MRYKSKRISIRLNEVTDKDIIEALDNHKDLTKAIKRLLRLGIINVSANIDTN